jgi:acyl-CoA thioesterase
MLPEDIVSRMLENDFFSRWLGVELIELKPGYCLLSITVKKDMLNGFGVAHGGISYSIADSALAFASNSKGQKSLSIETSISHLISLKENDLIVAEAICEAETEKLGHYSVRVFLKNDPSKIVAIFKGMVYKTSKNW